MSRALKFVIGSHAGRDGVTLSLVGEFGNLPFATDEGAARAARAHANGRRFSIERKSYPALPPFGGHK